METPDDLIGELAKEIMEVINKKFSSRDDMSMGDGIYIASTALAEVAAFILVGNLPKELLHKAGRFAKGFCKILVGNCAMIVKKNGGPDFFSQPVNEEDASDESGSSWSTD